jgi:hypothetical protein
MEDSGLTKARELTTERIYGPNGRLPQYWGHTWDTGEAMHGALCFNMSGGVPIEIIREIVALAENQWPGFGVETN